MYILYLPITLFNKYSCLNIEITEPTLDTNIDNKKGGETFIISKSVAVVHLIQILQQFEQFNQSKDQEKKEVKSEM